MYSYSKVYTIYVYTCDVKSAHTHTLSVLFGDIKSFELRREGRRDWEGME